MRTRLSLPIDWMLPKEIAIRLGETAGRQRMMFHEGHMLLILHKVPEKDSTDRVAALFYRTPLNEWKSTLGAGIGSLQRFLVSYEEALQTLDKRLSTAKGAQDFFEVLGSISPIERAAKNLHETLQTAREALPEDKAIITARDNAYEIRRTAELLYEEARHGLDYEVAKRAEEEAVHSREQARAAHRLNLLAATFFPIMTVAAVLGANMPTGFERINTPILFWFIMAAALFAGFKIRGTMGKQ